MLVACVAYGIIFVLLNCSRKTASCSGGTVSGPSGTVQCPNSGTYSHNLDVTWSFPENTVYKLTFSRIEIESCCDNLSIIDGDIIEHNVSKFRLSNYDFVGSEFYLKGSFHVKFTTDGYGTAAGFTFFYEVVSLPILAPTEIISQSRGFRASHPDFPSNYPARAISIAWGFIIPPNSILKIHFDTFRTEPSRDNLKIVPGVFTNQRHSILPDLHAYHDSIKLNFSSNITLLFTTDGNHNNHRGFRFYFQTIRNEARCTNPTNQISVEIDLINRNLWSATGVIQFHAVSHNVCPSVRHLCELRTHDGNSLPAQLMHTQVSDALSGLSSVMSQFAVLTPEMVSSEVEYVIECRVANLSIAFPSTNKTIYLLPDYPTIRVPARSANIIPSIIILLILFAFLASNAVWIVACVHQRRRSQNRKQTEKAKAQDKSVYSAGSMPTDEEFYVT